MFSRFEMKMLLFFLIFSLLCNSSESYKSKNDEEIKVDEEEELQLYQFIQLFLIVAEKKRRIER